MLTGFENSFTGWLSNKFPPHSNALLHYLVKWLCSIIAMTQSWVKRIAAQDSAIQKVAEKYSFSDVSIISVHWQKYIYSGHTENPQNGWQYNTSAAPKKKDVATKRVQTGLTFNHWCHQSESLSITESRLTRPIIGTWCCYNSFCLLYVRPQARSLSFTRTEANAHALR